MTDDPVGANRDGSSWRKISKKERPKLAAVPQGVSWCALSEPMLGSAAWWALEPASMKILFRLLLEHLRHAGHENGRLPCTFADFERAGVRRGTIAGAIAELEALGFVECVLRGRPRFGGYPGSPSQFRLTFYGVATASGSVIAPTHEWKRHTNVDTARTIAKAASARIAVENRIKSSDRKRRTDAKCAAVTPIRAKEAAHG